MISDKYHKSWYSPILLLHILLACSKLVLLLLYQIKYFGSVIRGCINWTKSLMLGQILGSLNNISVPPLYT